MLVNCLILLLAMIPYHLRRYLMMLWLQLQSDDLLLLNDFRRRYNLDIDYFSGLFLLLCWMFHSSLLIIVIHLVIELLLLRVGIWTTKSTAPSLFAVLLLITVRSACLSKGNYLHTSEVPPSAWKPPSALHSSSYRLNFILSLLASVSLLPEQLLS